MSRCGFDAKLVGLQADAVLRARFVGLKPDPQQRARPLWVGLQADGVRRIEAEGVGLKPDPQRLDTSCLSG